MEIKKGIIKSLFFDNYGQRRYFSGDFEVGVFSQVYPQFAFPKDDEEKLKQYLIEMFNLTNHPFDQNKNLNIDCYVITTNSRIYGFTNKEGQIFSLSSIYDNEYIPKEIDTSLIWLFVKSCRKTFFMLLCTIQAND